jgi:YVTN family beta-propeller protein
VSVCRFEQQSGACERKYESESYEHPDSGRDQIEAWPPCTCTTTGACPEARTAIELIECIVGTQARLLWPGKRRLTAGKRRRAALLGSLLNLQPVEIRILGPMEVISAGAPAALGGPKQRAFLAALVLARGKSLSVERLVDMLWGESPPPTASKTVHVYVSRLRKVLGEAAILTSGSAYRLVVDPEAVDAWRFERLLQEGRDSRERGPVEEAARVLRAALALWRGTPLADLVYEPFAQAEIARLEELRLVALEERIDADLELGGADELVPELEALVREHPLRERLRAQLMLALYRSGRQADALAAYQDTRTAFAEELALKPGPALRELEHAILTHAPELGAASRIPRTALADRRRRALLLTLAGVVLLAAAVTVVVLSSGSVTASLRSVAPDSLAFIDPWRNAVVGELPVGSGPAAVTVGDGSVWVANAGDQTLAQIDPASKQVVDRIGLGRIPTQLAFGQGALWIASAIGERGVVSRVDPTVRAVVGEATVRVRAGSGNDLFAPATPSAIAVGDGGVLTNDLHSQLWWLSHGGRARTLTLGASHSVDGLAIGEGAVWVASGADDRVLRLDPVTGRVIAQIPLAAVPRVRVASPYGIAVGDGSVWVTDALADTVSRIDPTVNAVTATIKVGRRPTRLAVGESAVWVLNAGEGTVSKIDPATNAVTARIIVGSDVTGIAAGLGGVWVTVGGGPPGSRGAVPPGLLAAVSSPSCSPILRGSGSGSADLLIASDLPTFNPGPAPDPVVADMRAAIRLVLEQHHFRAGHYRIAYQACNDSRPTEGADPDLCAANARAYALDQSLVGVIGAYNSFCSGIELPTLGAAPSGPVAMISPTNTYVGLTHGGPATAADEPDRYYPTSARNFVHLVATDDYQSAGIDLFLKRLGRTRLYVLDDGEGTGYAGALYAEHAAGKVGLTVAGSGIWNPNARDYQALARRVAATHADAVLMSGCVCSHGAKLVADLRRALGDRAILIGPDNFTYGVGFIHTHVFDGVYVSSAGLPAQALPPTGREFLAELLLGRRAGDIDQAVGYAAQATEILLQAIAKSDGTRASITRGLLSTTTNDGIAGPVSFNDQGDPSPAPIAIYRIDSHARFAPHRSVQGLILADIVNPPIAPVP